MAEIFFRSRGENYPLKNSKLDCLGGIFFRFKDYFFKNCKKYYYLAEFFHFCRCEKWTILPDFFRPNNSTYALKNYKLTTIWPSFFSGPDVKMDLAGKNSYKKVLEILIFSHFLIIMKVEGLLQGGLRPP